LRLSVCPEAEAFHCGIFLLVLRILHLRSSEELALK
jgi:hypothetical protein